MLEALKIAFENNKKTLAYVKGILRNWCSKKLKDFSGEKSVMGSLERRKCMLSSVF
ncbi:DnaD domain protein [Streptococcus pneumoniae]|nr:DnaD domain protein [Streptococcus pneumoniae]CJI28594.1 DnaD domain protein [Streptococcus pneumoniae]